MNSKRIYFLITIISMAQMNSGSGQNSLQGRERHKFPNKLIFKPEIIQKRRI
jgi:hypothetical protein